MLLKPPRGARPKLALGDLPAFVRDELDLHGLNLSTDLLAGATRSDLGVLRDRADKAGCACLTLIEPEALDLATENDSAREAAIDRGRRVVEAAHVLGCSAAVVTLKDAKGEDTLEYAIDSLRRLMSGAEKRDLHLLLAPGDGMTGDPDELTDLVKKTGGFRIGTYPDLAVAAIMPDPDAYLRRITPYAAALRAGLFEFRVDQIDLSEPEPEPEPKSKAEPAKAGAKAAAADDEDVEEPTEEGEDDEGGSLQDLLASMSLDDLGPAELVTHTTYALEPLIQTITSVGYDQTIGIEYRGKGDPVEGLRHARAALEDALLRVQSPG
jgi:sugar phosphate isomerase/epimerase